MNVTLVVTPFFASPGDVISGSVSLSLACPENQIGISPLRRYLIAKTGAVPSMHISLRLIGSVRLKQFLDIAIFESASIEAVTDSVVNWELLLPKESLPPSFHRGVIFRCIYYLEAEISHPQGPVIRRFRVPICLRNTSSASAFTIPECPYTPVWIRTVSPTDGDNTVKRHDAVSIPAGPSSSDRMMEKKLSLLEKKLRAEFDALGLKQPEDDWHWVHSPCNIDDEDVNDECESQDYLAPQAVRFNIDICEDHLVTLLLSQDKFCLGDVVRGLFHFEDGKRACIKVDIRLISTEIGCDQYSGTSVISWGESRRLCHNIASEDFSLLIPPGPLACATFTSDTCTLSWSLEFKFFVRKKTSTSSTSPSGSREDITNLPDDQVDILNWSLPILISSARNNVAVVDARKIFFIHYSAFPTL